MRSLRSIFLELEREAHSRIADEVITEKQQRCLALIAEMRECLEDIERIVNHMPGSTARGEQEDKEL